MTVHRPVPERRTEILDAAVHCFARKGYHLATMDEIVETVGLSKGAIYWHFKGKRDLFARVLESWNDRLLQRMQEEMGERPRASDKIRAIFLTIGRNGISPSGLLRAHIEYSSEARDVSELRAWNQGAYERLEALFREVLEEGMRSGEFRRQPVGPLARQLRMAVDGALAYQALLHGTEGDSASWNTLANAYLSLLSV